MKRSGLVTLVLASLLSAAPAGAREVGAGRKTTVGRPPMPSVAQLHSVWEVDETGGQFQTGGALPRIGDRYLLVDDTGPIGEVEVDRLESFTYGPRWPARHVAHFSPTGLLDLERRADGGGSVVALGPIDRAFPRARTVLDPPTTGLPLESFDHAVDLNADGRPDLLRGWSSCAPDVEAAHDASVSCIETWSRSATGWKRSDLSVDEIEEGC